MQLIIARFRPNKNDLTVTVQLQAVTIFLACKQQSATIRKSIDNRLRWFQGERHDHDSSTDILKYLTMDIR